MGAGQGRSRRTNAAMTTTSGHQTIDPNAMPPRGGMSLEEAEIVYALDKLATSHGDPRIGWSLEVIASLVPMARNEMDTRHRLEEMEKKYLLQGLPSGEGDEYFWRLRLSKPLGNVKYVFEEGHHPQPARQHANGGGWVALSATVGDHAYVGPEALVYGNAIVDGSAIIAGEARVAGDARVIDSAVVQDKALVSSDALICEGARISDDAFVTSGASVRGSARVGGNAVVQDNAWIEARANVAGHAVIANDGFVGADASVSGSTQVYDSARVEGHAKVFDDARVGGDAVVTGDAAVCGDAQVRGDALVVTGIISEGVIEKPDPSVVLVGQLVDVEPVSF